jgi:hypothetical protein
MTQELQKLIWQASRPLIQTWPNLPVKRYEKSSILRSVKHHRAGIGSGSDNIRHPGTRLHDINHAILSIWAGLAGNGSPESGERIASNDDH